MFEGIKNLLIQKAKDTPNVKPEIDQLVEDISAREKCGNDCSPDDVNKWSEDFKNLEQKGGTDAVSAFILTTILRSH